MSSGKKRTIAYVDAFNVYYGCCKGTPHKWLDLKALLAKILPGNEFVAIKYFTARVKPHGSSTGGARRQQLYLRALQTVPEIEIVYGHFLRHRVPMAKAGTNPPEFVRVIKTEEKGSDVNLATHLLLDAFRRKFEVGVVVSNDSDLCLPLRVVREEMGLPVGVINPHQNPSQALKKECTFLKNIRQGPLRDSQFPDEITDSRGSFSKPTEW